MTALARNHGKNIVFLSRASEFFDEDWYDFFSKNGTPFLEEYEKALKAISSYISASREKKAISKEEGNVPLVNAIAEQSVALSADGLLSNETTQELASAYQIQIPASSLAESPEEAVQVATRIGFPVALKLVSRQLTHKTEAGVVALGIKTPSEVEEAFRRINDVARRSQPGRSD